MQVRLSIYRTCSRWTASFTLAFVALGSVANIVTAAPRNDRTISHHMHDYVPIGLHDLTVTLKTGRYDKQAGAQINKEFGMLYKLSGNGEMRYQEPNSIRFDGKIGGMPGALIMDGFTQRFHIGLINRSQDQSQAPGRVTTLLDLGLISKFYLSYTVAQFLRIDSIDGTPCAVFHLSYPKRLHDTSFRFVWIDPQTHLIRKREEYGQDGALRAIYTYRSPTQVFGVWLPTEIDAANARGEFVGQTFLQNAHVNTGLADQLFR